MAIGLGLLRAAGRGRRPGRAEEDRERPVATVREVCLIGVDRRSPAGEWAAGREVTWLGRTYQVRATAGEGPAVPSAVAGGAEVARVVPAGRRYVHLAACGGDRRAEAAAPGE